MENQSDWFNEIKLIAQILNYPKEVIEKMRFDDWILYYKDCYSPAKAWLDELSKE